MFIRPLLAAIALAATASAPALSQDFIGTWTGNAVLPGTHPHLATLTLTLTRDANGDLTGSMFGGQVDVKSIIRMQGKPYGAGIEAGVVRGHALNEADRFWFEAQLDGQTMRLRLVKVIRDSEVPLATAGFIYTLARGDNPPAGNPPPVAMKSARPGESARAAQLAHAADSTRAAANAAKASVTGTWIATSRTGDATTMTLLQGNSEGLEEHEADPVSGTLVRGGVTYRFNGSSSTRARVSTLFVEGHATAGENVLIVNGEMNGSQLNVALKVPPNRRRNILGSTDSLTFVRR